MPEACLGCRHFRRRRGRNNSVGWCLQVDDGFTNDCLLDELIGE
jgi:hypothetical protein